MYKKVIVSVKGTAGAGVSTITSVIQTALQNRGIDVKVESMDREPLPNDVLTRVRVNALNEHGFSVTLTEGQLHREHSDG